MKKILIPTLLTIGASPLISLTACNDHGSIPPAPEGAVIIDNWTKTEVEGFFAITTEIEIDQEKIYRAVIDTKKLNFDKTFAMGGISVGDGSNHGYSWPIDVTHFYVNDTELVKQESYVDGETNYYINPDGEPMFFHKIEKGDVLAVDFKKWEQEPNNPFYSYITVVFIQGPGV